MKAVISHPAYFIFNAIIANILDSFGRCRWCTNAGEPILFIKYNQRYLNLLDVEKKVLTLKYPMQLERQCTLC